MSEDPLDRAWAPGESSPPPQRRSSSAGSVQTTSDGAPSSAGTPLFVVDRGLGHRSRVSSAADLDAPPLLSRPTLVHHTPYADRTSLQGVAPRPLLRRTSDSNSRRAAARDALYPLLPPESHRSLSDAATPVSAPYPYASTCSPRSTLTLAGTASATSPLNARVSQPAQDRPSSSHHHYHSSSRAAAAQVNGNGGCTGGPAAADLSGVVFSSPLSDLVRGAALHEDADAPFLNIPADFLRHALPGGAAGSSSTEAGGPPAQGRPTSFAAAESRRATLPFVAERREAAPTRTRGLLSHADAAAPPRQVARTAESSAASLRCAEAVRGDGTGLGLRKVPSAPSPMHYGERSATRMATREVVDALLVDPDAPRSLLATAAALSRSANAAALTRPNPSAGDAEHAPRPHDDDHDAPLLPQQSDSDAPSSPVRPAPSSTSSMLNLSLAVPPSTTPGSSAPASALNVSIGVPSVVAHVTAVPLVASPASQQTTSAGCSHTQPMAATPASDPAGQPFAGLDDGQSSSRRGEDGEERTRVAIIVTTPAARSLSLVSAKLPPTHPGTRHDYQPQSSDSTGSHHTGRSSASQTRSATPSFGNLPHSPLSPGPQWQHNRTFPWVPAQSGVNGNTTNAGAAGVLTGFPAAVRSPSTVAEVRPSPMRGHDPSERRLSGSSRVSPFLVHLQQHHLAERTRGAASVASALSSGDRTDAPFNFDDLLDINTVSSFEDEVLRDFATATGTTDMIDEDYYDDMEDDDDGSADGEGHHHHHSHHLHPQRSHPAARSDRRLSASSSRASRVARRLAARAALSQQASRDYRRPASGRTPGSTHGGEDADSISTGLHEEGVLQALHSVDLPSFHVDHAESSNSMHAAAVAAQSLVAAWRGRPFHSPRSSMISQPFTTDSAATSTSSQGFPIVPMTGVTTPSGSIAGGVSYTGLPPLAGHTPSPAAARVPHAAGPSGASPTASSSGQERDLTEAQRAAVAAASAGGTPGGPAVAQPGTQTEQRLQSLPVSRARPPSPGDRAAAAVGEGQEDSGTAQNIFEVLPASQAAPVPSGSSQQTALTSPDSAVRREAAEGEAAAPSFGTPQPHPSLLPHPPMRHSPHSHSQAHSSDASSIYAGGTPNTAAASDELQRQGSASTTPSVLTEGRPPRTGPWAGGSSVPRPPPLSLARRSAQSSQPSSATRSQHDAARSVAAPSTVHSTTSTTTPSATAASSVNGSSYDAVATLELGTHATPLPQSADGAASGVESLAQTPRGESANAAVPGEPVPAAASQVSPSASTSLGASQQPLLSVSRHPASSVIWDASLVSATTVGSKAESGCVSSVHDPSAGDDVFLLSPPTQPASAVPPPRLAELPMPLNRRDGAVPCTLQLPLEAAQGGEERPEAGGAGSEGGGKAMPASAAEAEREPTPTGTDASQQGTDGVTSAAQAAAEQTEAAEGSVKQMPVLKAPGRGKAAERWTFRLLWLLLPYGVVVVVLALATLVATHLVAQSIVSQSWNEFHTYVRGELVAYMEDVTLLPVMSGEIMVSRRLMDAAHPRERDSAVPPALNVTRSLCAAISFTDLLRFPVTVTFATLSSPPDSDGMEDVEAVPAAMAMTAECAAAGAAAADKNVSAPTEGHRDAAREEDSYASLAAEDPEVMSAFAFCDAGYSKNFFVVSARDGVRASQLSSSDSTTLITAINASTLDFARPLRKLARTRAGYDGNVAARLGHALPIVQTWKAAVKRQDGSHARVSRWWISSEPFERPSIMHVHPFYSQGRKEPSYIATRLDAEALLKGYVERQLQRTNGNMTAKVMLLIPRKRLANQARDAPLQAKPPSSEAQMAQLEVGVDVIARSWTLDMESEARREAAVLPQRHLFSAAPMCCAEDAVGRSASTSMAEEAHEGCAGSSGSSYDAYRHVFRECASTAGADATLDDPTWMPWRYYAEPHEMPQLDNIGDGLMQAALALVDVPDYAAEMQRRLDTFFVTGFAQDTTPTAAKRRRRGGANGPSLRRKQQQRRWWGWRTAATAAAARGTDLAKLRDGRRTFMPALFREFCHDGQRVAVSVSAVFLRSNFSAMVVLVTPLPASERSCREAVLRYIAATGVALVAVGVTYVVFLVLRNYLQKPLLSIEHQLERVVVLRMRKATSAAAALQLSETIHRAASVAAQNGSGLAQRLLSGDAVKEHGADSTAEFNRSILATPLRDDATQAPTHSAPAGLPQHPPTAFPSAKPLAPLDPLSLSAAAPPPAPSPSASSSTTSAAPSLLARAQASLLRSMRRLVYYLIQLRLAEVAELQEVCRELRQHVRDLQLYIPENYEFELSATGLVLSAAAAVASLPVPTDGPAPTAPTEAAADGDGGAVRWAGDAAAARNGQQPSSETADASSGTAPLPTVVTGKADTASSDSRDGAGSVDLRFSVAPRLVDASGSGLWGLSKSMSLLQPQQSSNSSAAPAAAGERRSGENGTLLSTSAATDASESPVGPGKMPSRLLGTDAGTDGVATTTTTAAAAGVGDGRRGSDSGVAVTDRRQPLTIAVPQGSAAPTAAAGGTAAPLTTATTLEVSRSQRDRPPEARATAPLQQPPEVVAISSDGTLQKPSRFLKCFCTMLCIHIHFDEAFGIQAHLPEALETISACVQRYGGAFDVFLPEMLYASFGSRARIKDHAVLAVQCAIEIFSRLSTSALRYMTFIIDTGIFSVGICGVPVHKGFVIWGRPSGELFFEQQMETGFRFLVTDTVVPLIRHRFRVLPVDVVTMEEEADKPNVVLYLVLTGSVDEPWWEPFSALAQEAFLNLIRGNFEQACPLYEQLLRGPSVLFTMVFQYLLAHERVLLANKTELSPVELARQLDELTVTCVNEFNRESNPFVMPFGAAMPDLALRPQLAARYSDDDRDEGSVRASEATKSSNREVAVSSSSSARFSSSSCMRASAVTREQVATPLAVFRADADAPWNQHRREPLQRQPQPQQERRPRTRTRVAEGRESSGAAAPAQSGESSPQHTTPTTVSAVSVSTRGTSTRASVSDGANTAAQKSGSSASTATTLVASSVGDIVYTTVAASSLSARPVASANSSTSVNLVVVAASSTDGRDSAARSSRTGGPFDLHGVAVDAVGERSLAAQLEELPLPHHSFSRTHAEAAALLPMRDAEDVSEALRTHDSKRLAMLSSQHSMGIAAPQTHFHGIALSVVDVAETVWQLANRPIANAPSAAHSPRMDGALPFLAISANGSMAEVWVYTVAVALETLQEYGSSHTAATFPGSHSGLGESSRHDMLTAGNDSTAAAAAKGAEKAASRGGSPSVSQSDASLPNGNGAVGRVAAVLSRAAGAASGFLRHNRLLVHEGKRKGKCDESETPLPQAASAASTIETGMQAADTAPLPSVSEGEAAVTAGVHVDVEAMLSVARRYYEGNMVQLLSVAVTPTHVYVFTEWSAGRTLRETVNRFGGRLALTTTRKCCVSLLRALDHLHNTRSVVHGRVHPDNILFGVDGSCKLTGMQYLYRWALNDPPLHAALTHVPAAYCSPEENAGEAPTAASDIYAFGLLLLQMLTGEVPWTWAGVRDVSHASEQELQNVMNDDKVFLEAAKAGVIELRQYGPQHNTYNPDGSCAETHFASLPESAEREDGEADQLGRVSKPAQPWRRLGLKGAANSLSEREWEESHGTPLESEADPVMLRMLESCLAHEPSRRKGASELLQMLSEM